MIRNGPSVGRIPILKLEDILLVTIIGDLDDRSALQLQDDLGQKIVENVSRGVLIDISALELVDSFLGRVVGNLAAMASILDARIVVVGMRPAVAITLVELGISLAGVRTALNVDAGLKLLRASGAPPSITPPEDGHGLSAVHLMKPQDGRKA